VKDREAAGHIVLVVRPTGGSAFVSPGAAARLRARPWRAIDAGTWSFRAAAQIAAAKPDRIITHWCVPCAWPPSHSNRSPAAHDAKKEEASRRFMAAGYAAHGRASQ